MNSLFRTVGQEPERYKFPENVTIGTNTIAEVLQSRLDNNRDGQVLITSRHSERGLGKTTLAIRLARMIEGPEWPHKKRSFVSVDDYLTAYNSAPEGSVLILDEGEHGADSRRAMSKENVDLSQAWATLRYRNIITLVTMPSVSMIDKRLLELADFRINVLKRGTALPINIQVNDFTGKVSQRPIQRSGSYELIHFEDLDDDPAFEWLTDLKHEAVTEGVERYTKDEVEKRVSEAKAKAESEAEKRMRGLIIGQIYENTELTQEDISEAIDEGGKYASGVSQPVISKAIQRYRDNKEGRDHADSIEGESDGDSEGEK